MKTIVLIDTQNVHMGIQSSWWTIDRRRFFWFLRDKFSPTTTILFMGYMKKYEPFYTHLKNIGYEISFKKIVLSKGIIKWNIDTHLVLKSVRSYYEEGYNNFILVSWDGDFDILVDFLLQKKVFCKLLVPNIKKASQLLKNLLKSQDIQDLNVLSNKLGKKDGTKKEVYS